MEEDRQTKIRQFKEKLALMDRVMPWDKIKVGRTYHIGPIMTLSRRDICVTKKTEDEITYKVLNDTSSTKEMTMSKNSIWIRFLVAVKSF